MQIRGQNAPVVGCACARLRLKHQRAGTVAEQHTGGPVCPVHDLAERFRPDHQHAPGLTRDNQRVGIGQRIDKACADRLHIKGKAARHAQFGLHHRRGRGKCQVSCRRGKHDRVQIIGVNARIRQRGLGRSGCHGRGRIVLGGEVTPLDARARANPFVSCVQRSLKFSVLNNAGGQIMPNATHHRAQSHVLFSSAGASSSAIGVTCATRAASLSLKPSSASCAASLIAAETPVASAPPWDFTTVPFNPKNTPPFTRRGSIRRLSRCSEVKAKSEASRDRGEKRKACRNRSPIRPAVPSPVLMATLPVKPSVTITSATSPGISPPSTKPMKSKSAASACAPIRSKASFNSARPLCSSVPTFSSPMRGRGRSSPLRA
mmetsp:Transcript_2615/g.4479  ORF Transcript_2615/g.4479 Transcript_2615/m.4479 type:complete len:375 (+) Transcript_2615:1421-2545(+)